MNILKLTYDFSKKYLAQYLYAMTKPILIGFLGLILFSTIFINRTYVIVALLSIPCLCYAFWRGYVITYFLCDCANSFLNNENQTFDNIVRKNKDTSKKLAGFVLFCAIMSVILYIPSVLYSVKDMSILNKAIFINTLFLAPFLNYSLQSYYYKKQNESYLKLFLNCYSKLNLQGIVIALFITIFMTKLLETTPILYIILVLIFNVFIYAINTFWYFKRINNK